MKKNKGVFKTKLKKHYSGWFNVNKTNKDALKKKNDATEKATK